MYGFEEFVDSQVPPQLEPEHIVATLVPEHPVLQLEPHELE